MKILSLFFLISLTIACGGGGSSDQNNTETSARYKVTFTSQWNSDTHPDIFPFDAHFSPLVGMTHNQNVKLWESGQLASQGVEQMAESGGTTSIRSEIQTAIDEGTGYISYLGSGTSSSGSIEIDIDVTSEYPLATLVSMIAPSPDWFIGTQSINLLENGSFVSQKSIDLFPYDSGTDSGNTYNADDLDTDPQEPISLINGYPFSSNIIGTILFEKL